MSQICLLLINFDYLTYTDHHTFCLGFFERSFLRIIFFIPSFKNSARSVFRGFRIAHFTKWKLVDPCWSLVRFCGAVGSRKGDSPGMYISYIIDAMMQQIFILPLLRCDHFQLFFLKVCFSFSLYYLKATATYLPRPCLNTGKESFYKTISIGMQMLNFLSHSVIANLVNTVHVRGCCLAPISSYPRVLPCAPCLMSEDAAVRVPPNLRSCCSAPLASFLLLLRCA